MPDRIFQIIIKFILHMDGVLSSFKSKNESFLHIITIRLIKVTIRLIQLLFILRIELIQVTVENCFLIYQFFRKYSVFAAVVDKQF